MQHSATALAQSIPNEADPGKILRSIEPPVSHPNEALPEVIREQEPETPAMPSDADSITFRLDGITFSGNSVFSNSEIAEAVTGGLLGKTVSLHQIFDMTAQITQMYQSQGYILSKAYLPPQEIENGTIQINIVEGYIARVRTEGNFHSHPLIDKIIDRITASRPLRANDLERYLLQLRDLAGLDVRSILEPLDTREAEGAVGMLLVMNAIKAPPTVTASINNDGSRYVGPGQARVTTEKKDLFGAYGTTNLSLLATTPESRELTYVSLQQTLPLTIPGLMLTVNGSYNVTRPGFTLRDRDIESVTTTCSVRLSQSIIRTRAKSLFLDIVFDIKNIETSVLNVPLYDDQPRTLKAGFYYSALDATGTTSANLTLSKGLNILGATKTGSSKLSRSEARSDFAKIEIQASRLQSISQHLQIISTIKGQHADTPLVSSEEFGFGGAELGRAYDDSELSGDRGIAASLEARFPNSHQFNGLYAEPFVSYDVGKSWDLDSNGHQESAASTAAGINFFTNYGTNGRFFVAFPLTKNPNTPSLNGSYPPNISLNINHQF